MFDNLIVALKAKLSVIEYLIYTKWIIKYALKGNWQLGTEMGHWAVSVRRYRHHDPMWVQPMPMYIQSALDYLYKIFGDKIKILELGPGPLSRLTEGWKEGLYDLISVDPLATEYRKTFVDFEYLTQGVGEEVHTMFPPESFHMSYASNCLDHAQDPLKCFQNMYLLTKPGGIICIDSNVKEGTRARWSGLHQFDIWVEEDRLMCKTKNGEPYMLTEGSYLEILEYHDRSHTDKVPWFSIMFKKMKEVDD